MYRKDVVLDVHTDGYYITLAWLPVHYLGPFDVAGRPLRNRHRNYAIPLGLLIHFFFFFLLFCSFSNWQEFGGGEK